MTITVEDGTGLNNADAYVSIAYCDLYHSNLENSSWTGTDAVKEAAIRKATTYLDSSYSWKGYIVKETQSLGFPRNYLYDKDGRDISNSIPVAVKQAVAELALKALSEDLLSDTSNSDYVKKEKVDVIEIEYQPGVSTQKRYNFVDRLLTGLILSSSDGLTVNLVR